MCRSMADIRSTAAEIRRGKKKEEDRNYSMKIYMVSLLHRATINQTSFSKLMITNVLPHFYESQCRIFNSLFETEANIRHSPVLYPWKL